VTVQFHVVECRSCGARIFWGFTKRGKAIPLDELPSPDGNLALEEHKDGLRSTVLVRCVKKDDLFDRSALRYVSHFATCPDAPVWRKK